MNQLQNQIVFNDCKPLGTSYTETPFYCSQGMKNEECFSFSFPRTSFFFLTWYAFLDLLIRSCTSYTSYTFTPILYLMLNWITNKVIKIISAPMLCPMIMPHALCHICIWHELHCNVTKNGHRIFKRPKPYAKYLEYAMDTMSINSKITTTAICSDRFVLIISMNSFFSLIHNVPALCMVQYTR